MLWRVTEAVVGQHMIPQYVKGPLRTAPSRIYDTVFR